jgi:nucleoside 2-deoxyribosyltransferase
VRKDRIYKAGDFDDPARIKEYREKSDSQLKEEKDVAHYLSKELAAAIMNDYRENKDRPKYEKEKLKYVLNCDDNLRMITKKKNQGEHRTLDRAIWRKAGIKGSDPPEALNVKEAGRAVKAANAIYEHCADLDDSTVECFVKFFGLLKFSCNVWDYVEA